MILLDTHIWLWWLLGDGALSSVERNELDNQAAKKNMVISWVSIWETEMLERKGRITLEPDFKSWIHQATNPDIITILPVDVDVIVAQRKLPPSFHEDPADRLLTSTSILSGFPLATHDRKIRLSKACKIWTL